MEDRRSPEHRSANLDLQSLTSDLPAQFCGLLTHSGSRGVGYAIANSYIRVAAQETARRAKAPR